MQATKAQGQERRKLSFTLGVEEKSYGLIFGYSVVVLSQPVAVMVVSKLKLLIAWMFDATVRVNVTFWMPLGCKVCPA